MTHIVGSCYTNGSDVYVHIPKNASTAIKDALGWDFSPHPIGGPGFAVVRDPVDRWFSGVWQYSQRYGFLYVDLLAAVERGRSPVFDEHTQPQVDFLEGFSVDLVRLEDAAGFVHGRYGVRIGTKNQGDWVRKESLVPLIADFYAADAALYESA